MGMKKTCSIIVTILLALTMVFMVPSAAFAETEHPVMTYEHDPMENPKAAEDIVVNPDAVYGYSPNPDSTRLGEFADAIDWTDDAQVADARQQRADYHEQMSELYRMIEDLLGQGKNVEEIARAVSRRRNEIRLESYKDDPDGLAAVKKSNLDTYGNEEGPTAESLYEKYGSWQTVLEKALSTNPGMDACLGFYDEYYDTYDYVDTAVENGTGEEPAEEAENEEAPAAGEDKDQDAQDKEQKSGAGTYTVESGDCLWSIAEKVYGDGSKWRQIYEENKDLINNPSIIYKGQELVIPDAA